MPGTLQLIKATFLDCFSTSTGHGLPQMAKPDNVFLRVLWAVLFVVALVGNCAFIYQVVDQYLQFGVINTTKIIRESQITMPVITFRSDGNPQDMILGCQYGKEYKECINKMNNVTLYTRYVVKYNCTQINHGANLTELVKAEGEGEEYGYS